MHGIQRMGTLRQLASVMGISVVLGAGAFALSTHVSHAGESCQGLDTALRNNLNFIAGQRAHPDANSAARIANRQAVVDLVQQRRAAAGCTADVTADQPAPGGAPPGNDTGAGGNTGTGGAGTGSAGGQGSVVCAGSTVTLSGEAGGPAASSNQFPLGTRLRITNTDNNKSTTVTVTSTSGSCVLLNNAAFEQVREPGKFLIRHAVIERVG